HMANTKEEAVETAVTETEVTEVPETQAVATDATEEAPTEEEPEAETAVADEAQPETKRQMGGPVQSGTHFLIGDASARDLVYPPHEKVKGISLSEAAAWIAGSQMGEPTPQAKEIETGEFDRLENTVVVGGDEVKALGQGMIGGY